MKGRGTRRTDLLPGAGDVEKTHQQRESLSDAGEPFLGSIQR